MMGWVIQFAIRLCRPQATTPPPRKLASGMTHHQSAAAAAISAHQSPTNNVAERPGHGQGSAVHRAVTGDGGRKVTIPRPWPCRPSPGPRCLDVGWLIAQVPQTAHNVRAVSPLPTVADDPHLLPRLGVALGIRGHLAIVVIVQTTVGTTVAEYAHARFPATAIGADDFCLRCSADKQRSNNSKSKFHH